MMVGSLFSGIGGLELGLERAGMKTLWQVECDPYARKVLEKHWPDVRRENDVRAVHGPVVHGAAHVRDCCLAPVDIVCGGFPCQDISVAGKGAGLAGERSGLWSEFRRLIGEIRPRFVLVENVSALLVRGLGAILGDLAALGYDAEWDCIPAAAVGAPHRRDRLFIVAYAQRDFVREQSKSIARRSVATESRVDGSQRVVANSPRDRWQQGSGECDRNNQKASVFGNGESLRIHSRSASTRGWWTAEPDVGRVAHGVSSRVDRLRCLGNAVVPQVAEFIGRRIMEVA